MIQLDADRLALAETHALECEERVARQRQLVERLTVEGSGFAKEAASLLEQFEATCALAHADQDRLRAKAQGNWPWPA